MIRILRYLIAVIFAVFMSYVCFSYTSRPFLWFIPIWIVFFIILIIFHKKIIRIFAVNMTLLLAIFWLFELYASIFFNVPNAVEKERQIKKYIQPGEIAYGRNFNIYNKIYGYGPPKGVRVRDIFLKENQVYHNVVYTIDKNRLRTMPHLESPEKKAILCFGDSFVFGQLVEDNETYPYLLQKKLNGQYQVINFGFPGYGPHQMLRCLQLGIEKRAIRDRKAEYCFYLGMINHIYRATGKVHWGLAGPKYDFDDKGHLIFCGPFYSRGIYYFTQFCKRSDILHWMIFKYFRRSINHKDLIRYIAILNTSRLLFKKRYGGQFYVILWCKQDSFGNELKRLLRQYKIQYVMIENILPDFDWNRSESISKYVLKDGWHPNAKAYNGIASYLVKMIHRSG